MKNAFLAAPAILALSVPFAFADTQWSSLSDPAWTTTANWTNGTPNGSSAAYFVNNSTYQHHLALSAFTVTAHGLYFAAGTGSSGFNISETGSGLPGQININAGGTANGIFNADGNTQLIGEPIVMFSVNGFAGTGASQTWNASSGGLVISGVYNSSANSINLNGGRLTFDGAFNTTIGNTALNLSGTVGRGDIVGPAGITKNGSGTLTLAGNAANTYSQSTILNSGTIATAKGNALGSSSQLVMNAGTFKPLAFDGGTNQINSSTTLSVQGGPGTVSIDFGNGATNYVYFADSHGVSWGAGSELDILGWAASNTNFLRFGTSATGLTAAQLAEIKYPDMPGIVAAVIDANGYVTPVPEPSTVVLSVVGGFGLALGYVYRRRKF